MGKNEKLVSLTMPEKAKKKPYRYMSLKEHKSDLVFPNLKGTNLKDEKRVATRIKTINRNLNRRLGIVAEKLGIEKKLSMHAMQAGMVEYSKEIKLGKEKGIDKSTNLDSTKHSPRNKDSKEDKGKGFDMSM